MVDHAEGNEPPRRDAGLDNELPTSFFRTALETANEGVWTIDCHGLTTFANDRMAEMLGLDPQLLLGRHPRELLVADDVAMAADVIGRTLKGEPQEFEPRFRRADGSELPTLGCTAPIRDEDGAIVGAVGMFSDLTARKAVEHALVISERQARETATLFLKLLESSSDAIWMRDPEGRFQLANPPAALVLGGTSNPAKIIGKPMEEVWGAEFAAVLQAQTQALLESGISETVEERVFDSSRQGPAVFLSTKVPLYNDDGSPLGVLGVSRDITDLKRVEDNLRRSEARLAHQVAELNALYASAPIGLAFFDRDHRYLRINQELADINGIPLEQHLGRTIGELLPENALTVEPLIDRVFATGEPIREFEVRGQTPLRPGVVRHWLTGFDPVRADDGQVVAAGVWVIEISERKAAEEREHLLAREVDHRAKNLLAVVQSVVQLSRAETVAELKEGLIGRIQSLGRAHSLLADSRWEGVDFKRLVEEELAPFIGEQPGSVAFDGPPLLLRPSAAQSLALVLHELTTNAVKYGAFSTSGRLDLTWRIESRDGASTLAIDWLEKGMSGLREPEHSGFGSRLITTSIERQLRGSIERAWPAEGLRCAIRIPAEHAVVGAD